MKVLMIIIQIGIALSLSYIWIFRYKNMIAEFKHFGLPDSLRIFTCVAKLAISTMLIVGIWYPTLITISLQCLTVLMIFALLAHAKVKNPIMKRVPAMTVLTLSLLLIYGNKVYAYS
jgi:DoxX-like family